MDENIQPQLLSQAKNKDQSAIYQIFTDTRDFAYYIVKNYIDDKAAEALLKDSFIMAFGNLESYNPLISFHRWLHGIVSQQLVQALKEKKVKLDTDDSASPFMSERDLFPRDWLEQDDKCWNLTNGIAHLPEGQRLVLTMKYLSDIPVEEIATVTGLKENSVRSHLQKAESALQAGGGGDPVPAGEPSALTLLLKKDVASSSMPAEMAKNIYQQIMLFFMSGGKAPKIGAGKSKAKSSSGGGGNKKLSVIIWAAVVVLVFGGIVFSYFRFHSKQRELGAQLVSEYEQMKSDESQEESAYEESAQQADPPTEPPGETPEDTQSEEEAE